MATRRRTETSSTPRRRPATTPEATENLLIGLASDLAEKQLREGNASSQVMTHFLQLGSSREKLAQEKIKLEAELLEAKQEQIRSVARIEELYGNAINAMKSYSGQDPEDGDDDFEDR